MVQPTGPVIEYPCYDAQGQQGPLGACYDESNALRLAFYLQALRKPGEPFTDG